MANTLMVYIPVIILLGAGFAIGRFLQFDRSSVANLLHYALVPAYLFNAMLGNLRQKEVIWLVAFGAGLALLGALAVQLIQRQLKQKVDSSASVANIALFTLPVLTIAWNLKSNLRMALALVFVGMALGHIFYRARARGFQTLVRQPWLYAFAAAALVHYGIVPRRIMKVATEHLADASVAVGLIYLGTLLSAMGGFGRKDVWLSVAIRLFIGMGAAFIFFKVAPIRSYMHSTLMIGAMGPPATLGLAMMSRGGDDGRNSDPQLIATGIVITLIAYMTFPMYSRYIL